MSTITEYEKSITLEDLEKELKSVEWDLAYHHKKFKVAMLRREVVEKLIASKK